MACRERGGGAFLVVEIMITIINTLFCSHVYRRFVLSDGYLILQGRVCLPGGALLFGGIPEVGCGDCLECAQSVTICFLVTAWVGRVVGRS
ncbi:hypothetical protein STSP2_02881 [Anaerohalosphaera lusitana]|uniref:Uncharacterized protein n=1 Tax=Anaerohalosphaera lusitana TaxID=1936003 RepID=A0A1U9NQ96_9BACT|nr:hypothetical protein STSP2_02881 [Anaerohalosphaera lusitana]